MLMAVFFVETYPNDLVSVFDGTLVMCSMWSCENVFDIEYFANFLMEPEGLVVIESDCLHRSHFF
jgi:hypothetical protein